MTTTSFRAGALTCALLATTALAGPALAQTAQPSIHKNIDGNGVDLTDGSFNFALAEATIGGGDGALTLMRYFGIGSERDNVTVRFYRNVAGGVATISLEFGNDREEFSGAAAATSFDSRQGTGATLTKIGASSYRYVDAEGAVTTYAPPPGLTEAANNGFCSSVNEFACELVAVQTTRPDGHVTTYNWDVGENCIERYDRWGEPYYECAQFWRQRGLTNNSGRQITFGFQQEENPTTGLPTAAWRKRVSAALGHGVTLSYAYPATGVTEVTDAAGRSWRFTRDSQGRISGIRRPGSAADNIAVSYDGPTSLVVSQITADGVTTNYQRNVGGSTATTIVTDALNQQRIVTSDLTLGRSVSAQDELGRVTSFSYDANGRPKRTTAPEGNHVELSYDARGNVIENRATPKPGSPLPPIVASAAYPAACDNQVTCNKPLSTTDARGQTTNYSYDPVHGGPLSIQGPSVGGVRPFTRFAYELVGNVQRLALIGRCIRDEACDNTSDEVQTRIQHNPDGTIASVTVKPGAGDGPVATQAMSYDGHGNLLTVDGPLPGAADVVRYRYDAVRRLIGTISPDPDGAGPLRHRASRFSHRPDGQIEREEAGTVADQGDAAWTAFAPLQAIETGYDADSRPVTSRLVAGGQAHALTQASYDLLGRAECLAVRMNPATFAAMPASACSLGAEGGFGPDRISRSHYDPLGRVAGVEVALGTAEQAFEARATFTPNGQVETLTDGENNRTTYAFDGFDRLSRTLFPVAAKGADASNPADHEELTYDPGDNVVARRLRDGQVIGYSYDALSRLAGKDLPGAESDTAYTHDNLGRLLSAVQGTYALTFNYDALGRKLTESGPNGLVRSHYDLAGRRVRLDYPDAPALTLGSGFHVTYDYLITGEMHAVREMGATSGTGVLATFGYDDLGRRVSLTRGNGTATSYGYDAVSRLTSLGNDLAGTTHDLNLTFGHNPAGQIVSTTRSNDLYAYQDHLPGSNAASNGLNQLTQSGAATLSYDGRGNLISDGTNSYTFSAENLLTRSLDPGGSYSESSFAYDPLLRLDRVAAVPVNTGQDSRRTHDGSDVLVDSQTLNRTYRYVPGPNADEPLVMLYFHPTVATTRRWYHADERGSILTLSKEDGTPYSAHRYDEYGNLPSVRQPDGNWGRFQYTGQYWLGEPRLFYYKARMYDPKLGRFLQPDPIGYDDGLNLYGYVGGDPVNFTDPTGLCAAGEVAVRRDRTSGGGSGNTVMALYTYDCIDMPSGGGGEGGGGRGSGGGGAPVKPKPKENAAPNEKHRYDINVITECTADQAFGALRAPGNSAPGAPFARTGTHNLVLTGSNPITQVVNEARRSITNITGPSHIFHPGSVNIVVRDLGQSFSSISIVGTGTGSYPATNNFLGGALFGSIAQSVAEFCRAANGKPNIKR